MNAVYLQLVNQAKAMLMYSYFQLWAVVQRKQSFNCSINQSINVNAAAETAASDPLMEVPFLVPNTCVL